ncbi:hypothetical protein O0I10_001661 [Lichtheimia ornata]|uniref:Uncharacterized protein n=1 Tax=Lichtheimia ornata TaxID=688661 RepID=A0AAD7VBL6_9FUNG|nr:uncharacterized protein O0I10_001661 [Lichtheimia ornata]KAJ8662697.1 hypothetical protein O0I10_001661 [Lichtheimia ornata]
MYAYPDFEVREEAYHATHSFTRKFCGCMSLRGGCAMACALWIGLHLYCAILAFRYSNPVFSYLNVYALMVFGGVCCAFVVVAIFNLFSLFVESAILLRLGHRITWVIVVAFLIDYFGTIIVFSIEESSYTSWCVQSAQGRLSNSTASPTDPAVYNCHKLWEDELKLSIAIYIVMFICYLYWATCLWSFSQKIFAVQRDAATIYNRGAPPPAPAPVPPPPPPPMTGVMNMKPNITVLDDGHLPGEPSSIAAATSQQQEYVDDGQKSAAQHARILFGKLKSLF